MNCYKFNIQSKIFYVVSDTTFNAIDCLFEHADLGWFDLRAGDDVIKLEENEMICMKVLDKNGEFYQYLPDYLTAEKEGVIKVK